MDLLPFEQEVAFVTDSKDLLIHKYIPAARLKRLKSALELRKIEALEAQLLAAISSGRTIAAMQAAGVFEEEGKIGFIGKRSQELRAAAREAQRQLDLADAALREEIAQQAATHQARVASGMITRAEVASAIPVLQGSAV